MAIIKMTDLDLAGKRVLIREDLNVPVKDGKVTIDFNRCYNPWCAFSDGYNCPVPPKENHFEVKIEAGEKMFVGKKKK